MNPEELQPVIEKMQRDNQNQLSRTHTHNGSDSLKLNPKNFLGFPIYIVADATVAPSFTFQQGLPVFQIDNKSGTPHWSLWVYLPNIKSGTNPAWHTIALT